MPSEPLPINTWSLSDAYLQPENPDPAIRVSSPGTPDPGSDDISLLNGAANLAVAVMALVPELAVAGGVVTVFLNLIGIALSDDNEAFNNSADLVLKNHLSIMLTRLEGLQANVRILKDLNPVTDPVTYKEQLIATNAVATEALPEFMIASYRRQTAMLFLSAATIHLSLLRNLIDANGSPVWTETLRRQAAAYSAWLSETRQSIIDQRASEIGNLVAAPGWPPYTRNSIQDTRLVNGSTYYIDLSPPDGADARRADYINQRMLKFKALSWIKDIESCILSWKQLSKLCDRNNPSAFAGIPDGAAFPFEVPGASFFDRVDRVAWTGANKFSILPSGSASQWQTFAVPVGGMRPVTLVVGGTADSPTFTLQGGDRVVLKSGNNPTLSVSIDDRVIVKDKPLSVPGGKPLSQDLTMFPTFADSDTSAAFEKLMTATITEARLLFDQPISAASEFELHFTSSNAGRRDHWLIKGPNLLASKILTPNRDFIADKIIPTLIKPTVDAVIAAFSSCTEAGCHIQTYGPYGASQIYSYVVKFFAITRSQDRGWWTFEGDGTAGPWRMTRPAPPPTGPRGGAMRKFPG